MTSEQEMLVLTHQHLVPKIVGRYLRLIGGRISVYTDDLISEGHLALIETALKYDPAKGTTFKTLANITVPGRIIDYLRRVGVTRAQQRRIKTNLEKEVTAKRRRYTISPLPGWALTEKKDPSDHTAITLEKIEEATPENFINRKEALKLIKSLGVKYLSKRNRKILIELHVLEETAVSLSKKYKLNESRISQINSKNMAVLKQQLVRRGYTQTTDLL